ncbi:MAG: hypothetical protein GY841_13095 [FCB group bacterium]|nr:hypothetical protein [FCB group bacterium]
MAAERMVLRSQRVSIEEETTEGTPVAETANGAIMTSEEGAEFNLDRDGIPGALMSGSFSLNAPTPGMWSDDLGVVIPTKMRGIGTLAAHGPDWQMPAKSIFGEEYRAEAGVIDAASTALAVKVKSGGASPALKAGLLIYFPDQGEVRRIASYSSPTMTLDTPLSSIPSEDDTFVPGVNWLLSSSPSHPFFTCYGYYGESQDKRVRITSCKTMEMDLAMEVGGHCDMVFTSVGLEPTYDTTAQAITPTYDTTTPELICLDMAGWTKATGTATGTPTTTETILLTPNFQVKVGDSVGIEVSAGVWEIKAISAVSGDAPGNITLTHAAVSIAASATDSILVFRVACADIGESLSINMACPVEAEKCMFATYGKTGLANVGRTVTLESEPYFTSWEQFLMRDNSTAMSLMAILGDITNDDQNNIVAIYIAKKVITTASLTNDTIMKQSVSSQAAKDATLGNDFEINMAAF